MLRTKWTSALWHRPDLRLLRLWRSREGVSAVEFALILPVMATLFLGGFEISRFITASGRTTVLADTVAEMVSQATATLSVADMNRFMESAPLINPDILTYAQQVKSTEVWKQFSMVVTSVQFTAKDSKCTTEGCAFKGDVVFSTALNATARACGALTPQSTAGPGANALPDSAFGPGSLIVVDVVTHYKPYFDNIISETIDLKRTTYFRPRNLTRVNYANNCADFKEAT